MTPKQRGKAKAAKREAEGYKLSVHVWVPPSMPGSVHKVIWRRDDGVLVELEVLGGAALK